MHSFGLAWIYGGEYTTYFLDNRIKLLHSFFLLTKSTKIVEPRVTMRIKRHTHRGLAPRNHGPISEPHYRAEPHHSQGKHRI